MSAVDNECSHRVEQQCFISLILFLYYFKFDWKFVRINSISRDRGSLTALLVGEHELLEYDLIYIKCDVQLFGPGRDFDNFEIHE